MNIHVLINFGATTLSAYVIGHRFGFLEGLAAALVVMALTP